MNAGGLGGKRKDAIERSKARSSAIAAFAWQHYKAFLFLVESTATLLQTPFGEPYIGPPVVGNFLLPRRHHRRGAPAAVADGAAG